MIYNHYWVSNMANFDKNVSWILSIFLSILDILFLIHEKQSSKTTIDEEELAKHFNYTLQQLEILLKNPQIGQEEIQIIQKISNHIISWRDKTIGPIKVIKEKPSIRHKDPWGILETTWRLISDYTPTEDILIPLLCYEVSKKLHESALPSDAIRIPSMTFRKIIIRLLREAPYSQLLQNIKIKGSSNDLVLNDAEREAIAKIVNSYVSRFKTQPESLSYSPLIIEESKMFLESFNWGGLTVEKRILQLFYEYAQQSYHSAKSETDPLLRLIYAETTKLITRLSNALIKLERVRERLERMKP